MNIDTTKCIGCKKGIYPFRKRDDGFHHVDLFATPEAGAQYKCDTENIESFLQKNENGMYIPIELKEYQAQSAWWDSIIELAHDVFERNGKDVADFFNTGEKDNRMWNKSNEEIENALLEIAKEKNIEVTEDEYWGLLKFQ